MRRLTRPLAFAAGAALAVGAASVVALPSQAQENVSLQKLQFDPGYILLDTTNNQVRSSDPALTPQTIEVGCSLAEVLDPPDTPATPGLLDINPVNKKDSLGYGKNGIGVSGRQDKNGTRCADVDDEYRQALEVKAGGAGVGPFSVADLDIEFKGGGSLTWKAYRGSADVSSNVAVAGLPGDSADNGPDSGDGDNYRVVFSAQSGEGLFDRLVLTPTPGAAFSLEGGGDGTVESKIFPFTNASVFAISDGDGLLRCDKDDVDGYTEDRVTVFLTDCPPGSFVPFTLERDGDLVYFGIPASDDNAYRVQIEWEPRDASIDLGALPQVSYFTDEIYVDLELCGGTSAAPTVPLVNGLAEGQGFCVTGRDMDIGPVNGKMVVTERLYGVGDPFFKAN